MNHVDVFQQFARFQAARTATDVFDSDVVIAVGEGGTDPRILRQLHELPVSYLMAVRGFGRRRLTYCTVVESFESSLDEVPFSDFDVLDDLRTPRGQIQRQITALRRGALPYRERLARRLDFLLVALEDEGETWTENSSDSLRQMLLFLQAVPDFRCPTVTITPSATFRAQWQAGRNRHFAIDFLPGGQVRFVVFSPDPRHPDRVQRVSGIVGRVDVMKAVEPYNVHRWATDDGT